MSAFAKQLAQSVYTKEQLETVLGCCVCRADTDNEYYRNEDLKWECLLRTIPVSSVRRLVRFPQLVW